MHIRYDVVSAPRANPWLLALLVVVALAACDRFNQASIVVTTRGMSLAEVEALEKTLMDLLAEQGSDCLLQPAAPGAQIFSHDCAISGTGISLNYSRSPDSLVLLLSSISDGFKPEPATFREARTAIERGLIEAAGADRVEVRLD